MDSEPDHGIEAVTRRRMLTMGAAGVAGALAFDTIRSAPADAATNGNLTVYNVKDPPYLAVGNGVANDAGAIQSALTACGASGGGVVYLPPGTYNVASTLSIANPGVHLRGSGTTGTLVRTTSPTADIINVTAWETSVRELRLDSTVTRTAGSAIRMSSVHQSVVDGVNMRNQFNGINMVSDTATIFISNGYWSNFRPGGVGLWVQDSNDQFISNIVMEQADYEANVPTAGIRIQRSGGIWVTNVDVIRMGVGLLVDPPASKPVYWMTFLAAFFDGCTSGIMIRPQFGCPGVLGCTFTSCWTSTSVNDGVLLDGTLATIDGMQFLGHRSFNNGRDGFRVMGSGTSNWWIDASGFSGNSRSASNVADGVRVVGAHGYFAIRNSKCGPQAGYFNTQRYGVYVDSGSFSYMITGCYTSGNVSGGHIAPGGTLGTNL